MAVPALARYGEPSKGNSISLRRRSCHPSGNAGRRLLSCRDPVGSICVGLLSDPLNLSPHLICQHTRFVCRIEERRVILNVLLRQFEQVLLGSFFQGPFCGETGGVWGSLSGGVSEGGLEDLAPLFRASASCSPRRA